MNLKKKLLIGGAMLALIPMMVLGSFTVFKTTQTLTRISEDNTGIRPRSYVTWSATCFTSRSTRQEVYPA